MIHLAIATDEELALGRVDLVTGECVDLKLDHLLVFSD